MASINAKRPTTSGTTHEGGPARYQAQERELKRAVLACLLFEDGFYEGGVSIAKRIADLVPKCDPLFVASLAVEARTQMYLRHVPLLLVVEMAKHDAHKKFVRATIAQVVNRVDELSELLALYWTPKRTPLSNPVRRGLADAFVKFSEHQFAKYDREKAIRLRDVLFMVHPKAKDADQQAVFDRIVKGDLSTPDTWEVAISAAKGDEVATCAAWTRLLAENRLGGLALLRNLRNMLKAGVPVDAVQRAIQLNPFDRVLPFRFVAAMRASNAAALGDVLETAMLRACASLPVLPGTTSLLVDVSGSMHAELSSKSDMRRIDAAAALAVVAREVCQGVRLFTYHDTVSALPNYLRGFALLEEIRKRCRLQQGTMTGAAVRDVNVHKADRLIVITDEQSHDVVGAPTATHGYMLNIASERPTIAYGRWTSLTGFSENVVRYISELEANADGGTLRS